MTTFKTRIKQISKEKGKIILANDYSDTPKKIQSKTMSNIRNLHNFLCGIKFNFPQLLPLGTKEISKINKFAHEHDLQTIADIKLNDIGNTNRLTINSLWELGFDAVIVNPIMGPDALKNLVKLSHKNNKGIISLCHMSSPEAKYSYELNICKNKTSKKLYQLFLKWAYFHNVDGIVVGATFPNIVKYCKKYSHGKLGIYSPGIGTQGGSIPDAIEAGTDYLIVGRTIINSKDPKTISKQIQQLSM